MTDIEILCPHCGQSIQCDEGYRGMQINCPTCNQLFNVKEGRPVPVPVPTPPRAIIGARPGIRQKPDYLSEAKEWEAATESLKDAVSVEKETEIADAAKLQIKQRAKWWIVSTHVLTAGFAIPAVTIILGVAIISMFGIQDVVAAILMATLSLVGYIGGTFYSISYLKKTAATPDWPGCTMPSICSAGMLTTLIIIISLIIKSQLNWISILIMVIDLAAFGLITARGFNKLENE